MSLDEDIYRELVEQEEEVWSPMKKRQAFKECWEGRAFIDEILVLCGHSDYNQNLRNSFSKKPNIKQRTIRQFTLGALKSSEGKWPLNSEESVYLMEGCCESPADMFRNQNIYDLMIQDMFYMLLWRQRVQQHLN